MAAIFSRAEVVVYHSVLHIEIIESGAGISMDFGGVSWLDS